MLGKIGRCAPKESAVCAAYTVDRATEEKSAGDPGECVLGALLYGHVCDAP